MIRPRTGDFCYSDDEVNVILRDVAQVKGLSVTGIVFGALTLAGDVDVECVER